MRERKSAIEVVDDYLASTPAGQRGLQLGCGPKPIPGWVNVDLEDHALVDISCDLTFGLPFCPDGVFDVVFSEHFLEHIDRKSAIHLMRECVRVLKPGGVARFAIPDLDKLLDDYHSGAQHHEVNRSFDEELGGAFYTRGELFNIAMRAWGHTYMYNEEDLTALFKAAGFGGIRRVPHLQSTTPMLHRRETRPPGQSSLVVEGVKAGATSGRLDLRHLRSATLHSAE
jgi:predicted SAM-dependent methyltransferase